MLYLASQFVWFLLAAFALGFVMGWISQEGGKLELWSHKLAYAAAAWVLGAVVTWTQSLNGVAALWVETALLFVAVYAAGCAAAAALKAALEPKALAQAVMGLDGMPTLDGAAAILAGGGPGAAERAGAYVATLREALDATKEAADRVKEVKSVVDDGKSIVKDAKDVAKTVERLVKVDNEDTIPGQRPAGLAAARADKPDDLKLIKGIGPQNEERLHGLGIWHFDQMAAWTAQNVEWVGSYLAFPGRIEREDWVGQAKALARSAEKGGFDGDKPKNLLTTARDGKPDDLSLIKGIDAAVAGALNRLGIWHFDQIATLREPELRYLCALADLPPAQATNWPEDADILAHGGETAHSRAVKSGRGTS